MLLFLFVLSLSTAILVCFLLYSIYKLNSYITGLEEKLGDQITLTENLKQSMKDIIVEGFLQNDGRLKKFNIQTDRDVIYNGVQVQDSYSEL